MGLQATIALNISALLDALIDIGLVSHNVAYGPSYPITSGSGANQANQMFVDTRTIAISGTDDLDLNGTSLVNGVGGNVGFTRIVAILVKAAPGNVNDVVVGAAVSNQFFAPFGAATHTVKVKPGGSMLLVAPDATGYPVTAATADILRIANGGAGSTVTYDIVLIGS